MAGYHDSEGFDTLRESGCAVGDGWTVGRRDEDSPASEVNDEHGERVCLITPAYADRANLLAAAPELLDAADELVDWLESLGRARPHRSNPYSGLHRGETIHRREALRTAIAKASQPICQFCGKTEAICHGGGGPDGDPAHDFTPGGVTDGS